MFRRCVWNISYIEYMFHINRGMATNIGEYIQKNSHTEQ